MSIPNDQTVVKKQEFHDSSNFSQSEEVQRVQISKIHLPTGSSWKSVFGQALKDAAVIELKDDVQLSPKVKIRENVSIPRFCLSAFLLWEKRAILRFDFF